MKIPLSWLREFVELPGDLDDLIVMMDDLGLVVEGVEHIGEGLEDVIIARIDNIAAIEGADRVRLVTVDAGNGPLEIVCGAMNFTIGNHVPLAPVGAVLPGGFAIAERKMRGVTSNGMLCSARELHLSDDHVGLMLLDEIITPRVGQHLTEALGIEPDVVLDISIEGNRPDAWSILGVARDLATRQGVALCTPSVATPAGSPTAPSVRGYIDAPELCGRLTLSLISNVQVGPSPVAIAQRLTKAGMRPISNVVDASNLVMLEMGQPTHPYDVEKVAGGTIGVRSARPGETLTTLDGVARPLAQPGRGLGDAGDDCVIVDGSDTVIGLAGIMGGLSSEISDETSTVLLEAAYFDPMTIARSSKRHGLRSEASNRFERGVDPTLALFAAARFVEILRLSSPDVVWHTDPIDVVGALPSQPTITLRAEDVAATLGTDIPTDVVVSILRGLDFKVDGDTDLAVTPPARRLDIRSGAAGRADVIEEIARLYSYRRLERRTPTWPQPGRLSPRQQLRRRLRDVLTDLGANEVWTPTLGSDADFDVLYPDAPRVRITNPLASEESVLRQSMLVGLVRAWGRNAERGNADVVFAELGTVFTHPAAGASRRTRGGNGGAVELDLPTENERLAVLLARHTDSAVSAVAAWALIAQRMGIRDAVVRSVDSVAPGIHPTRGAQIVTSNGIVLGIVGEVDPALAPTLTTASPRRLGVIDLDLDALWGAAALQSHDHYVTVPSRFPSASFDLALVTPRTVHAADLRAQLAAAHELVQDVTLFDVYAGEHLAQGTRSLTFAVVAGSDDRTLSDKEIADVRARLVESAQTCGATLRA